MTGRHRAHDLTHDLTHDGAERAVRDLDDLVQHVLFAPNRRREPSTPAWADLNVPELRPLVDPPPIRDPALTTADNVPEGGR